MAKCANLQSFQLDICAGSLGGVKNVWLADYKDKAATLGNASGETGVDVITGFSTDVTWIQIPIRKNTASYTSEVQVNEQNGNSVQTTLTVVLSRMDAAKRMTFNALMLTDVMAVVEDANGNRVFLGYDNPVTMSSGTGQTGTAKTDANNYTIGLQDDSVAAPYFLSPDVVLKTGGE